MNKFSNVRDAVLEENAIELTGMIVNPNLSSVYSFFFFFYLEERPEATKLQDLVDRKDISVQMFLSVLTYWKR